MSTFKISPTNCRESRVHSRGSEEDVQTDKEELLDILAQEMKEALEEECGNE